MKFYRSKIFFFVFLFIPFYNISLLAQLSDASYTCNTQFIKFFNQYGSLSDVNNLVIKLSRMDNLGLKEDPKNFFDDMQINEDTRINAKFLDKNTMNEAVSLTYICKLEFDLNTLLQMKDDAEVLLSCSNELSMMKVNATKNIFYGTFGDLKAQDNQDIAFYRGRCSPGN